MLTQLSVHGFRNLNSLQWSVSEGSHLLLGDNGAGKTSLLEAIYLVATTRSFRTSHLGECLARPADRRGPGTKAFTLAASVGGEPQARLELSWSETGIRRALDSKSVAVIQYLEPLPVVIWCEREAKILDSAPERRRQMLDRGLVNESLKRLALVARYRQCLRQKRELLKRCQGGLEEWNRLLALAAADLIKARARYTETLEKEVRQVMDESGLRFPSVALRYVPSPRHGTSGAPTIEEALGGVMEKERRLGRPLVGPHLDSLQILWGDAEVSVVASAGEKKALGLLLMVAQARLLEAAGRMPLLLADDVDSELDRKSLEAIWRVLERAGQIVVSCSKAEVWDGLEVSSKWSVKEGSLSSLNHT